MLSNSHEGGEVLSLTSWILINKQEIDKTPEEEDKATTLKKEDQEEILTIKILISELNEEEDEMNEVNLEKDHSSPHMIEDLQEKIDLKEILIEKTTADLITTVMIETIELIDSIEIKMIDLTEEVHTIKTTIAIENREGLFLMKNSEFKSAQLAKQFMM